MAAAAKAVGPNFQRYAQDVARELQNADFYTYWSGVAAKTLAAHAMDDLRPLDAEARAAQCTSQTAWDLRRLLSQIDVLYGQGKLDEAGELIESSSGVFTPCRE